MRHNFSKHCGMESHNGGKPGGTCAIQYLLENVDLSRVGAIKIGFFIYHLDLKSREICETP